MLTVLSLSVFLIYCTKCLSSGFCNAESLSQFTSKVQYHVIYDSMMSTNDYDSITSGKKCVWMSWTKLARQHTVRPFYHLASYFIQTLYNVHLPSMISYCEEESLDDSREICFSSIFLPLFSSPSSSIGCFSSKS